MCEATNIHFLPLPMDAHFSHEKVDRRILTLKEMSSRVFHEMHVVDVEGARAAIPRMAEACNRLCNRDGFSPAQWVPRDGVQLPGSAVDIDDPCIDPHVPEGSAFWHRLRFQEACDVSFRQAKNNSARRRASLHQARPQPGPFDTGSWIHYWRSRGGKRATMSRWPGPARVLGRDKFGDCVIHNGAAVLCSANCIRFNEHGAQRGRPLGQHGFADLRREKYRETTVPAQAPVSDSPRENDVPAPEKDMNQPDGQPQNDEANAEIHEPRDDTMMTPPEDMATDEPQVHDERPVHDETTRPEDVPASTDVDDDEWLPKRTAVPATWDMLIGGAACARDGAVQPFHLIDVNVPLEEGYNVDPRDLRRRQIFLYHRRELLEHVQKTDAGWPFALGRVVDEALGIVVELAYRVPESKDEPFAHSAASPPGDDAIPPEVMPPTITTTRRSRGGSGDNNEGVPPHAGPLQPELGSRRHAESDTRRKQRRLRRAGGYDDLDHVFWPKQAAHETPSPPS